MKLSEALEEVNRFYIPGTVKFFAKMEGDPWQTAHDELEGQLLLNKDHPDFLNQMQPAIRRFVSKLKILTDQYALIDRALRPKSTAQELGFFSNSIQAAEAKWSNEFKRCGQCMTGSQIRVCKPTSDSVPGLYCEVCVPRLS